MNLVYALLVALCAAAVCAEELVLPPYPYPPETEPPAYVLSSHNFANPDGSFQYGYETSDGTSVKAQGEQRAVGPEGELGTVMQGSYSFVGADGITYSVSWTADENGFRAEGDHLPRA